MWSAKIINNNPTQLTLNHHKGLKSYYCQTYQPSITLEEEEGEGELWKRKIEDIRKFQRERPQQEITGDQAEKLIAIYLSLIHI